MIEMLLGMKSKTLLTLAQNKKFTVEVVNEAGVVVRVHGIGNNRTIGWSETEKACDYLRQPVPLWGTKSG